MRWIALTASVALVVTHWDRESAWFWVGVGLVALSLPGVAAAFAAGPQQWHQVSYVGDDRLEPTTAQEIAHHVWIEHQQGWEIGLGDEVKPYLDLDIDESEDPIIGVLEAHPSVEDAFHEDREVYGIEHREPLSTEELAVLVARALVAHHVHVAARS